MLKTRAFNIKLHSRIHELGFRNCEVAFTCQIHEADFSRIVNGRKMPTEEQKKRLCEFLKSSLAELGL